MDQVHTMTLPDLLSANQFVCLNMLVALIAGAAMGYERSYHGRAAGMRTYALVCMASAGLTAIGGAANFWFGGFSLQPDPTRVIQGIVTGIGFLGAGVIMREGFSIHGLATAASIWMAAAVGVIIGVGLYGAAAVAIVLTVVVMSGVKRLELILPRNILLHATLTFDRHNAMGGEQLRHFLAQLGYQVLELACQTGAKSEHFKYDLLLQGAFGSVFNELVDQLAKTENLLAFQLTPSRD
jgi:putative Mg2+ transporter-C (MgtC) family protein